MEEKDLYSPVKTLFESMDYKVQGEVRTVDVVAQKDDHLVAIELKKRLEPAPYCPRRLPPAVNRLCLCGGSHPYRTYTKRPGL